MADKPATGGKRFFKLASMTASVATRYATSKLKSAFLEGDEAESERSKLHEVNGAKIVETLGELKGCGDEGRPNGLDHKRRPAQRNW